MKSFLLISTTVAVSLLCLGAESAQAQDYFTVYRQDEVGPRTIELDEEGFLNIQSYRMPLEAEQAWYLSDRGYRIDIGSLDLSQLWAQQDLRVRARMNEDLAIMTYVHQGVDFDTPYVLLQPSVEWRIFDRFELLFPISIEFDKGDFDFGLGARWRSPENGIEYLQFTWLRADILFNSHGIDSEVRHVSDASDTLEFQGFVDFGAVGSTVTKIAWQAPSSYEYGDAGKIENFERFSGWLLHEAAIGDLTKLFLELAADTAEESLESIAPETVKDEFEGDRSFYSALVEAQWNLDAETTKRIRGGLSYLSFREDEELPNDKVETRFISRDEVTLYGGYRFPLSDEWSLESVAFGMWRDASNEYPYNWKQNGDEEDAFQAKLNLYFRWDFSENGFLVIIPSFELDSFGWGGGAAQFLFYF